MIDSIVDSILFFPVAVGMSGPKLLKRLSYLLAISVCLLYYNDYIFWYNSAKINALAKQQVKHKICIYLA